MCMRPCGPVRHFYSHSSVRKATVKNYEFKFWTDSLMCDGQQVSGRFKCLLRVYEAAILQDIVRRLGRDYNVIKNHAPSIGVKIKLAAYKALEYRVAEDVYDDFDFTDPKFRGWKKDRKIRYIISSAEEPISSRFSIGIEIPEGFSAE